MSGFVPHLVTIIIFLTLGRYVPEGVLKLSTDLSVLQSGFGKLSRKTQYCAWLVANSSVVRKTVLSCTALAVLK